MKVWPSNDNIRKVLKHPTGGPFRAEGPAEWPDDSYTARRIADGDVTTEDPKPVKPPEPHDPHAERLSPRSRPSKPDTE